MCSAFNLESPQTHTHECAGITLVEFAAVNSKCSFQLCSGWGRGIKVQGQSWSGINI